MKCRTMGGLRVGPAMTSLFWALGFYTKNNRRTNTTLFVRLLFMNILISYVIVSYRLPPRLLYIYAESVPKNSINLPVPMATQPMASSAIIAFMPVTDFISLSRP